MKSVHFLKFVHFDFHLDVSAKKSSGSFWHINERTLLIDESSRIAKYFLVNHFLVLNTVLESDQSNDFWDQYVSTIFFGIYR